MPGNILHPFCILREKSLRSETTELSPSADLTLRIILRVPDEELLEDIGDADADNKEDECSK